MRRASESSPNRSGQSAQPGKIWHALYCCGECTALPIERNYSPEIAQRHPRHTYAAGASPKLSRRAEPHGSSVSCRAKPPRRSHGRPPPGGAAWHDLLIVQSIAPPSLLRRPSLIGVPAVPAPDARSRRTQAPPCQSPAQTVDKKSRPVCPSASQAGLSSLVTGRTSCIPTPGPPSSSSLRQSLPPASAFPTPSLQPAIRRSPLFSVRIPAQQHGPGGRTEADPRPAVPILSIS